MPVKAPVLDPLRSRLATRFDALGTPGKAFAKVIRTVDATGKAPCWGELASQFDAAFKADADRLAAFELLAAEGDRRALLALLAVSRTRTSFLAQVVAKASVLAPEVQRALVSLLDPSKLASDVVTRLHPAARELCLKGGEVLSREREQVDSRIADLLAFRFFVPDTVAPIDERKRVSK
jgi:hypothetical protein